MAANRSHDGLSPSPPLVNGGEGRGEVALSYSDQGIVTMRPLLPTLSIWQKCLSMTWLWYYDIDNLADPRRIANRLMPQVVLYYEREIQDA